MPVPRGWDGIVCVAMELDLEMDYPLMPNVMPEQKPGRSEQVVETPPDFIKAIKSRLGIHEFAIDLAANKDNAKAHQFYSEDDDALIQGWVFEGWDWCNPPYSDIEPWVAKAAIESQKGAKVAMLLPASVGSNWWATHVDRKAYVTFLNGRITFEGHTGPYPKDLVLLLYAPFLRGGSTVWRWK